MKGTGSVSLWLEAQMLTGLQGDQWGTRVLRDPLDMRDDLLDLSQQRSKSGLEECREASRGRADPSGTWNAGLGLHPVGDQDKQTSFPRSHPHSMADG